MTYARHGKSLIEGRLTPETDPLALVDAAVRAAEEAFDSYSHTSAEERARFLETIAAEIDARGEAITAMAMEETGLPEARLIEERARTTGQLRLIAAFIRAGRHLDLRHNPALPDRRPAPRPDLRLMQRAIGPVAVFGASNFPLAFSVAGGDTASALAAGCTVVVKSHDAHPGTSEIVAEAIATTVTACDLPAGTFGLLRPGTRATGQALVSHLLIKAVGFTGSLAGGRALFDFCAARPEPIPFFGELGSVNPMFLFPAALAARAESLGRDWAASLVLGAGQFCTNPGIAFVPIGSGAGRFAEAAVAALSSTAPQRMLTQDIAAAYRDGIETRGRMSGLDTLYEARQAGMTAMPDLVRVDAETFLANPRLAEEVFGPAGLIVEVKDCTWMLALARKLSGQLTVTFHVDAADTEVARPFLPVFERMAGRILANGYPTGVEVCDAMVHGGPYPASTNFGATSVGTLAIRRFLRPVSYQNLPEALLPKELL